jgi:MFS family permease
MAIARRMSHRAAYWVVAATFLVTLSLSTTPTPLYSIYERQDGFSTDVVTIIFAAYAIGVVVSLYLVGHVSDWLGRRRILLIAITVELLAVAMFLVWPGVVGLLVARFTTGFGVGLITASATAYLGELARVARPEADAARAALVATVANIGGLALGPLIGGAIAEFSSNPLVTPYWLYLAVFVACILLLALAPETVDTRAQARPYRPQRIAVPRQTRRLFTASAFAAFASFAAFGIFTALAPTLLAIDLHDPGHLLAGVVGFSIYAAAVLAQIVFAHRSTRSQLIIGIACFAVGLTLLCVFVMQPSLLGFATGGVITGVGCGLLFRAAIAFGASVAEPGHAGEVLAGVFLIAYAGLALPVIALGFVELLIPLQLAVVVFCLGTLALAVLCVVGTLRLSAAGRPARVSGS